MFIDFLNKQEQEVFMSLANEIVRVDGELDKSELERIESLALRINGDSKAHIPKKPNLSIITKKETKRIILIELIGICYIDGNYCNKERKYVNDLAEKFNIAIDLKNIENWVSDFIKLTKKGVELINN